MTSPKHAKTTAKGRQYINPITGEAAPSVTTILGQIGKGEALKWWAASETAKYAVTNKDTWLQLDEQAAIDLLKREPLRSLNRAADRGTDVHAIADRYAQTGEIGQIVAHNGYVDALRKFFADHQPLPILAECTVWGDGYAGSFDMVCKLPALGDALVILDYKTSKAIYPDTAAQLAAYANAPQYLDHDDKMQTMPKVETGVIVRFGADGEYEVQEADLAAGWQLFQAALAIHRAQQNPLLRGNVAPTGTYDGSVLRTNIAERVTYIKDNHAEHMPVLMSNWIADLPPLSSDKPIHRHQLVVLDKIVNKVEAEVSAPFNPPPALELPRPPKAPQTVLSGDGLGIDPTEIETIRNLVNTAPKDVKHAIKETAAEASQAGTTLSLQGKPTLRRVAIAHFMLDTYMADHTNEREYMRMLLRYHNLYTDNIGTSLGRLDLPEINQMVETHIKVQNGELTVMYEANTDTFHIAESTTK
jgi:hypothetical protein